MISITKEAFTSAGKNEKELLNTLLEIAGYNIDTFADYMETSKEELENAPKWAFRYLCDLINADLVHLGYVMKDTKTNGLIVGYNEQKAKLSKLVDSGVISIKPIEINDSIISETGSIKANPLINAENLIKNYILQSENQPTIEIPEGK